MKRLLLAALLSLSAAFGQVVIDSKQGNIAVFGYWYSNASAARILGLPFDNIEAFSIAAKTSNPHTDAFRFTIKYQKDNGVIASKTSVTPVANGIGMTLVPVEKSRILNITVEELQVTGTEEFGIN